MDISEEEAKRMYTEIGTQFNTGTTKTQEELNKLVGKKTNLFVVVVSILYDINFYAYITGRQASNLVICILTVFLPKFEELIRAEYEDKIKSLEDEIDQLSKVVLDTEIWNWENEDGG